MEDFLINPWSSTCLNERIYDQLEGQPDVNKASNHANSINEMETNIR